MKTITTRTRIDLGHQRRAEINERGAITLVDEQDDERFHLYADDAELLFTEWQRIKEQHQ